LTAGLAKGLILERNGSDLSGEGMGFGVPAIVTGWRTYLSFTAEEKPVSLPETVHKTFRLDAIQKLDKRGQETNALADYVWLEARGALYKASAWAQRWLMLSRSASRANGTRAGFKQTEALASVAVEYRKSKGSIDVSVDLSEVRRLPERRRVYVLNELDAAEFPLFRDSDGRELRDHAIGGWNLVKAEKAGFISRDGERRFEICQRPGAALYRGRESLDGELSWSGLIYDVSRYPDDIFHYTVKL